MGDDGKSDKFFTSHSGHGFLANTYSLPAPESLLKISRGNFRFGVLGRTAACLSTLAVSRMHIIYRFEAPFQGFLENAQGNTAATCRGQSSAPHPFPPRLQMQFRSQGARNAKCGRMRSGHGRLGLLSAKSRLGV